MAPPVKKNKSEKLICYCNSIPQSKIEEAILKGCTTLGKIFDSTTAGVGACGGSCQPDLRRILDTYTATGTFPAIARPKGRKSRLR